MGRTVSVSHVPTPVDDICFSLHEDRKGPVKLFDTALLYEKSRRAPLGFHMMLHLSGIRHRRFNYEAGYSEEDYRRAAQEASFAIVFDKEETQGLALQELMAADVPLFVEKHDPPSIPYFGKECGMVFDRDTIVDNFIAFRRRLKRRAFEPASWVRRNLGLYHGTVAWVRHMCDVVTSERNGADT